MNKTQVVFNRKAKEAIKKGVNLVYNAVRLTFGPEGKNVLLPRTMNRGPRITNDGITVAECIRPKDPYVGMVAETFRESCKRTNEKVGDGTTCTTILAGKIFNEVYKEIDEKQNAFTSGGKGTMTLKNELLSAGEEVKEKVRAVTKKIKSVKDLQKIATVSVEDKELGDIIGKMAYECGVDGFIDVVEGYKGVIETDVIKGMRFSAKIPAKAFVNNPARYEMVAEDCPVLITNYKLDNAADITLPFQEILKKTAKFVVVAPGFSENVLINFMNAGKNGVFIHPVKAPSLRTEQFEDLAVYCGATFIDKAKGKRLQNVKFDDLGFFEKMIVKDTEAKEDAIITGGRGCLQFKVVDRTGKDVPDQPKSAVEERINTLKGQLEETRQENFKKLLERRIASMGSAVGVIRVGASTQALSLYKKLKIEDAVYACRSALRSGYVKGGGVCLKEISESLPEGHILKESLLAPYNQIQGSVDGGIEIGEDVIDPSDAIYYAVEHATQVVAQLLTVDVFIVEDEHISEGEGSMEIARMLREFVITDKINKGQLKASDAQNYRDSLGGLTQDEYEYLNAD